jgi:hypothetical protein
VLGAWRGTLVATFLPAGALQTEQGVGPGRFLERNVFSCDYNGWADVPEEEREGLDAFEATRMPPARALLPIRRSILPPYPILRRRAA